MKTNFLVLAALGGVVLGLGGGWLIHGAATPADDPAHKAKLKGDLADRCAEVVNLRDKLRASEDASLFKPRLIASEKELDAAKQRLGDLEKDAGDARKLLAAKNTQIEALRKTIDDLKAAAEVKGDDAALARLRGALEKAEAELKKAQDDLTASQAALVAKDAEIAELKEKLASSETPPPPLEKLAVAFGKWGSVEAVASAKWKNMGGAARAMRPAMAEVLKSIAEGRPPEASLVKTLQSENGKLVDYYLRIRGKVPTHFEMNGEFAHPVTWLNLASSQLEAAQLPLADEQVKQLVELGDEYERRWAALQAPYNESTFEFRKRYDEVDLKQWFAGAMYDVLTAEQRAELWDESVRGRVQLDLYSPGTMMQMGAMDFVSGESREALRTALIEKVATQWGLDRGRLDGLAYLFENWLNETASTHEPAAADVNVPKVSTVLACGKSQLKAMDELKKALALDDEGAKAMRAEKGFWMPRIKKPE